LRAEPRFERRTRHGIESACGLQSVGALELAQRVLRLWPEHAVDDDRCSRRRQRALKPSHRERLRGTARARAMENLEARIEREQSATVRRLHQLPRDLMQR